MVGMTERRGRQAFGGGGGGLVGEGQWHVLVG